MCEIHLNCFSLTWFLAPFTRRGSEFIPALCSLVKPSNKEYSETNSVVVSSINVALVLLVSLVFSRYSTSPKTLPVDILVHISVISKYASSYLIPKF